MSSKERPGKDASISIGRDATGNVIISGDSNTVHFGSESSSASASSAKTGVPKVFISSTVEDLEEHRAVARDAANGAQFLTVMLEYFAASGEHTPLPACMAKVDETDVTVVIIAHRYGWEPPGQEDDPKSVTWLECERTLASEKEVLAFLVDSEQPWDENLKEGFRVTSAMHDGTATPELLESVQHNITRLKEFKSWVSGLGIRLTFTTPEDLRGKISDALREWKERNSTSAAEITDNSPNSDGSTPAPRPTVPDEYRKWLVDQCADIELLGLKVKQGQAVRLNHIYVPLTTTVRRKSDEDAEQKVSNEDQKPALLLDALDESSIYVPGAPGAGKSTFCKWVAYLTACGEMPELEVKPPEGYAETFPAGLADRLPLLVRLRDFWDSLPMRSGRREMSASELEESLGDWIDKKGIGGLKGDDLSVHLKHGSALLILDGVDEVPLNQDGDLDLCSPREMFLSGLTEALPGWQTNGNRILLTSRPYGISDDAIRRLGIQTSPINSLPSEIQTLLVRRWFHTLMDKPEEARATADDMKQHIGERSGMGELTDNPMLLTAMCVIYGEGKRLPQDTYDLYGRIVDNVLYNRFPKAQVVIDKVRNRLSVVAHGMHTGYAVNEQRTNPQAEVTRDELDRILSMFQEESPETEPGSQHVVETREQLLSETGLLLPQGDERAAFYHLSIQEFLASQRLLVLNRTHDELLQVFRKRAATPDWRKSLSFLFACLVAKFSAKHGVELLTDLVDEISADSLSGDDIGRAVVAADCVEILIGRKIDLQEDLKKKIRAVGLAAIDQQIPIQARFDCAICLGRVGDPRIVVDLRNAESSDTDAFVLIEGDEPFYMSKYLVTNSQYGMFLNDGGYSDSKWWSEDGWEWRTTHNITMPAFWRSVKFGAPNQPVVGISYYEAAAFARWAGGELPSVGQWKDAGGMQTTTFPWGDTWRQDMCHTAAQGIESTSPVAIYPIDDKYKTAEPLGNVMRWANDRGVDNECSFTSYLHEWNYMGNDMKKGWGLEIALMATSGPTDRLNNAGVEVVRRKTGRGGS